MTEKRQVCTPKWFISARFLLCILAFILNASIYIQRVNMSLAIVCMVNHKALAQEQNLTFGDLEIASNLSKLGHNYTVTDETDLCPIDEQYGESTQDGPFIWTKAMQGHILAAFFYGYLLSQVLAGQLAERYGAKWVLFLFHSLATLGTFLTPLAASYHYIAVIAVRVIIGFGAGGSLPVFHNLWSRWSPPMERSVLIGFTQAGCAVGTIISMPLTGFLCANGFSNGWPSVFYVSGLITAVCLVLWLIYVSDSPETHRFISIKEKKYILNSLKETVPSNSDKGPTPWKAILTSAPVWAIVAGNVCTDWGLYTLLTNIPTYYKEVHHFDLQQNSLYSCLPFIGLFLASVISPVIIDLCRGSGKISTVLARKVFQGIGNYGVSIFLLWLSFLTCHDSKLAVALLVIGTMVDGIAYSGYSMNHVDIAPKYAGTLMGLTNSFASATGFLSPLLIAAMTPNGTQTEWQRAFFLSIAIYVTGATIFIIFASGEVQGWAKEPGKKEEEDSLTNGKLKHDAQTC